MAVPLVARELVMHSRYLSLGLVVTILVNGLTGAETVYGPYPAERTGLVMPKDPGVTGVPGAFPQYPGTVGPPASANPTAMEISRGVEPYWTPPAREVSPPGPIRRLPPTSEDSAAASADLILVEPKPAAKLWKGNFELGLDGSEGNSQRFNLRFGVEAKRKTDDDVLSLDLDYHRNTSHSRETAHRTFLDWRYEWLFKESPWTWFGHGTIDYDEFQAFDVRVSVDTGLGYQFVGTDATSLLGRCSGGWSREIGGPDEDYVPEVVFGLEFERQLSERQRLTATADYAPDVTDFGDFRLNAKAGWEVLLDEQKNLRFKLSVVDRHDSTPHGAKPNDVDYSATLLWSF